MKPELFTEPWRAALSSDSLEDNELLQTIGESVKDITTARKIVFLDPDFSSVQLVFFLIESIIIHIFKKL
jgi:hypothetical protein